MEHKPQQQDMAEMIKAQQEYHMQRQQAQQTEYTKV